MKHTKFRTVLVLLLLIFAQTSKGQKSYNIEIIFTGIDVDKAKIGILAYEGYRNIPFKKDSSNYIFQKIAFSAKLPIIEISYFSSKHSPSFFRYFLTSENCKIVVHYEKEKDIVTVEQTSGVISFEEGGLNEFKVFAKNEIETKEAFSKNYNSDFTAVDSSVENTFIKYDNAVRDKGLEFVKRYPNLLYSTYLFTYDIIRETRYSTDELLDVYNHNFKPRYQGSFEENFILIKLDADRLALNSKAPLPNKVFKDLNGSTYSISSFGNKLVLVNIWSTSCVPCMEEIPKLKELYARYQTSMEIVSFSTDDDEQKVRNIIKAKGINWINVCNQPEISYAYGSDIGIPQVFLLNEKGMIIYSKLADADTSLEQLENKLEQYTEKRK